MVSWPNVLRIPPVACLLLVSTTVSLGQVEPATSDRVTTPRITDPVDPVRSALKAGEFPWYDPAADEIRSVPLPNLPKPSPNRPTGGGLNWEWGDYLVFVGFTAALLVLGFLVFRYWKRFEPKADAPPDEPRLAPTVRGGEALPAGLRRDSATDDPWAEANRRRLAGDFAGAILCLFVHQLLSLSRLGLLRLAPGRTGRQLHRSVADREFQGLLLPTLRQFEAVYYGHRTPTADDFAAVWDSAEAFERRVAEQGAR